jgi:hypothetical protein
LAAVWYPGIPEVVDPELAVGTRARQISTIRGLQPNPAHQLRGVQAWAARGIKDMLARDTLLHVTGCISTRLGPGG